MRVMVTGADGFVGRHLVERLVESGLEVSAGCRPGGEPVQRWLGHRARETVTLVPLEVTDSVSVSAALSGPVEAIVHLAAVSSSRDANRDPGLAWNVNAAGVARVLAAVKEL